MEYMAFVLIVTLMGVLVVGGICLLVSRACRLRELQRGQSERELEFLAQYDAARHVRGDV